MVTPGTIYSRKLFYLESRIEDLLKGILGLYYYYRIHNSISTKNGFNIILNPLYYIPFCRAKINLKNFRLYIVPDATIEKKHRLHRVLNLPVFYKQVSEFLLT